VPDLPNIKLRAHPIHRSLPSLPAGGGGRGAAYAELAITSNFTFLTGASHPDELVQRAAELGHMAAAIADTNTLAGVVRAHVAAKEIGIPLAIGSRLRFSDPDGLEVIVFPTGRASYARLCRLLTRGKRRAAKGECQLKLSDLLDDSEGLLAIAAVPGRLDEAFAGVLGVLRESFGERVSLAASALRGQDDRGRLERLARLASEIGVPLAAINEVLYHCPQRRALQDVLTCIRLGCTIGEAGLRLVANAEHYLKTPEEMRRLFSGYEGAVERSVEIAARASAFSLDELRYEYPDETVPPGSTPMRHLIELAWSGAAERYPGGIPAKVRSQMEHELGLIDELDYAPYFLTCHDIVRYARSEGILCQGRGAAANSAVCYCLGITSVDPDRIDVLFERFVSRERNEPPDIDIDFEHERREEVIQYIYGKYGRDRAALTAEVITYRGRSAVREVGKAMGLSLDCVDALAKGLDWWESGTAVAGRLRELGLNPGDATLRRVIALTGEIQGFPRHLSQHVGGFVISRGPVSDSVPVENAAMPDRTIIEWDKDDIDALGILKIDILGLGMLSCIRKSFEIVERHGGGRLTLASIPAEDPAVFDMVCAADTIGVFQIESRAQMSMLPRLRPRCFYDLVIEVAIVRPGPIQGDMVHPYLRRRTGEEEVSYPRPEIAGVLAKTLGVPLFQEQAMQLAIVAAGFSPGEADQLRRAMAAWKRKGDAIQRFGEKFVKGMVGRGYSPDFAHRCFEQIKGFSEYGFPESHAASFALLVYVSAWLKRHHPAAFAAALLNSQPMGFYAPAQIVRDAREHGVEVRPIDVHHSDWDCTLEPAGRGGLCLRLGQRLVKGLRQRDAEAIAAAARACGPFSSIEALRRASGVPVVALRRLAGADAYGSLGLDRQAALWHVRGLRDQDMPLFDGGGETGGCAGVLRVELPAVVPSERVRHDYSSTGLSLKAHPVGLIRDSLDPQTVTPAGQLRDEGRWRHGGRIAVAGIVTCRQRPGTASGVVFMTLEDETGYANLIIRPHVYDRYRRAARHGTIVLARGRVERRGEVVHITVTRIESLDHLQPAIEAHSRDFH
jgi:error-prone DNA polymerase